MPKPKTIPVALSNKVEKVRNGWRFTVKRKRGLDEVFSFIAPASFATKQTATRSLKNWLEDMGWA